jgi:hypothetical protein
MSAYDVIPQMRFSKGAIATLALRMPWRETTALGQLRGCNVPTARRRYVASPEEAMVMRACYLARRLLWNFRCCFEKSPTSMSLASRSAPVPLSPLAPYPCEARVQSERRARYEYGARSERGTGTEREWEAPASGAWRRPRGATQEGASGRHQPPTGAWRRPRGATQEGASTERCTARGREHMRARAREAQAERRARE